MRWLIISLLLWQVQTATVAPDPNAVIPGEFVVEPPTLINLGFEWFVEGDLNRNATVSVSYRKQGQGAWIEGLPMLRIGGERIYSASRVDLITPNMFAGSVLDLESDTGYEVQFSVSDASRFTGGQPPFADNRL